MFHPLTENLSCVFRKRHSWPSPGRARACLRVEPLEARLVPSTIDWNQTYQTIDGFGASSAWIVQSLTQAQANLLYSTTQGIGLSLLRSRILPDTSASSWEISTMKTAQSMGVTVWSTPWSPPAQWKDNGSVNNGGHLLASHYQDYADLLAQYVRNMQAQGITIHAVSIANEPNFTTSYESSRWTADEFAAFLPVLADTFARDGVTAKILLPEETSWNYDLASKIFNDPNLLADVGIVAGHNYGGTPSALPQGAGRGLWETETSAGAPFDPGIGNALGWAKNIHDFMTVAHADAWHYWWIHSAGNDNAGLLGPNWELSKRFWAVGNYSRFVRPGWVDISATDDGSVLVSAFKDPVSGQFAIVAINQGNTVAKTFNLNGFVTGAVTPWVTSANFDLAQQADIAVNGGSFTADLPAQSVTTFVGASAVAVDLSDAFNRTGIYDDGSAFDPNGGLDGYGYAYSSAQLGSSVTWNGAAYNLGASGVNDVVQTAGQTIALPQGQYSTVALLATGVNGNQANQTFTVTYADGTTQTFTQSISDWGAASTFPGESVAVSTNYRDHYDGGMQGGNWQLFGYQLALDPTETVVSITLPDNPNVNVCAMNLLNPVGVGANTVDLSAALNRTGIYDDGATFASNGGLDGHGYAYSSAQLGSSVTWNGATFNLGDSGVNDVVRAAGQTIALPQGQHSSLVFLGTAVNGNQANQKFTVTYTDGTNQTFTQGFSDWAAGSTFDGESVAVITNYRNYYDGSQNSGPWNLYGYQVALDPTKTVYSITLPNNSNVNLLAMNFLDPAQAPRPADQLRGPSVSLGFLGSNGNPVSRTFSATNADETFSPSVNTFVPWMLVPEPAPVSTGNADGFNGRTYGWPPALDPMKTVDSALWGANDDLNADRLRWWVD